MKNGPDHAGAVRPVVRVLRYGLRVRVDMDSADMLWVVIRDRGLRTSRASP